MDLTISFYLVAGAAVLITGLSKSGFGGGLGVMSVPLMSLYITPQLSVAILMPILLVMDLIVVWKYRACWNRSVVARLLPGAASGLVLGGLTFQWLNADAIRFAVGSLAVLFVAQFAWSKRRGAGPPRPSYLTVFALGLLSGFASFVAHAGGPPVKGLLLRQQMSKSMFVGTNTMFFFAMNATKTVAYAGMGQFTSESIAVSVLLAPALFVGIGLGLILHHWIAPTIFTWLVYGLLLLTGAKLLFDSVGIIWGEAALGLG